MRCPNGCKIEFGLCCGGDLPWYEHGWEYASAESNIHFYVDLQTGELTHIQWTAVPFVLTPADWAEMHRHALGGCISEMQCPECKTVLQDPERKYIGI